MFLFTCFSTPSKCKLYVARLVRNIFENLANIDLRFP